MRMVSWDMSKYFTRDGIPTDIKSWARELEDVLASKRVVRTRVSDAADPSREVDVSTVYLGRNHQDGDGPPLIFESAAFGEDMDAELRERYPTASQALIGHRRMVAEVASLMTDPIVIDIHG